MQIMPKIKPISALVLGLLLSAGVQAAPDFVNGIAIPGATGDTFGNSVNDGRLGFFSDIYYDPNRNEWWGLSDRGPGGGTLSYDTRVQRFTLGVDKDSGEISKFQVVQTIKFSNKLGVSMDGISPGNTLSASNLGNAFDPEGIVINPLSGNLLVSDEYGPSLYEFARDGQLIRAFKTPEALKPKLADGSYNFDGSGVIGRRTNRGFEGLAISPNGNYTYAMLQSAMMDEGGGDGKINRIVKFDNSTGTAVAQYAYEMKYSVQGQGISALVAINDNEFMVLERNNRGIGVGATFATADKEVYKININGATDVTGIDLDAVGAVYTKVTKSDQQWLDLDADTLVALGNKSPEKWEGLAIGPKLNDGSFLLLAGTDNDYSVTQNGSNTQFDVYFRFSDADPYASSIQCPIGETIGCFLTSSNATAATLTTDYQLLPGVLHAYKVSAADLGNYTAPVPEPETYALLLAGLGLLGFMARRRKM